MPMTMLKVRRVTHESISTGRELHFVHSRGNRLKPRDATWKPRMPAPTYEEIIRR